MEYGSYFTRKHAEQMLTASKLASSAAHLLGKPRVLVEAFGIPLGCSPWQVQNGSMIS